MSKHGLTEWERESTQPTLGLRMCEMITLPFNKEVGAIHVCDQGENLPQPEIPEKAKMGGGRENERKRGRKEERENQKCKMRESKDVKMTNFDTHSLTSEGSISHISVFEGEGEERGQLGLSWGSGWVRESADARGALPHTTMPGKERRERREEEKQEREREREKRERRMGEEREGENIKYILGLRGGAAIHVHKGALRGGRGGARGDIELGIGAAHCLWRSDWTVSRNKGRRDEKREREREREKEG